MSYDTIPWIIATVSAALMAAGATMWALRQRRVEPAPLPEDWALTARPVFSSDERRVYRQLREALPHHIVLSKLPLVRFCQPTDLQQVRYWYELLGAIHVGFAVCSANGRVLAAIDIDNERGNPRRSLLIKQMALAACRVRYLRFPVDQLPSLPELQLLVPQHAPPDRAPGAAPLVATQAPGTHRRPTRTLWRDSGFFPESLFGADGRSGPDTGSPAALDAAGGALGRFMRGRSDPPPADDSGLPTPPAPETARVPPVRH